jgi:glycosyltransferase involved in cell wall biosynthesis
MLSIPAIPRQTMDYPRISVITPSYNQGEFLEATIRSVLDQQYPNLEYIVIDGLSADNSKEIIQKYSSKIAYWCSEKDNGQSQALNKGLERATGSLVGWINSDDLYYPGSLEALARCFEEDPGLDVVFADYDYIDDEGKTVHRRKETRYDLKTSYWTAECFHANVAALFRRECFQKWGGLREDLHMAMDYEFYLRLGVHGCRFAHLPRPCGAYRLHSLSKTVTSQARSLEETRKIRNEYSAMLDHSRLLSRFLPPLYRVSRYVRKLLNGCYSLDNLVSVRIFKPIKRTLKNAAH